MNTTELGSRRLHVWRGRHHGSTRPHGLVDAVKEDTATLAEAIVEAVELFNAGGQLVQLDPTGKIIPINRAALHGLVSKHIAAVRVVNVGTADPPIWQRQYYSFGFEQHADTAHEPDAKVLDELFRNELLWRLPKVVKTSAQMLL
jgi:hypothetical protein